SIDDLDREGHLGVRVEDQILSHTVDVLIDHRIGDELRTPVDLGGELPAESDLFIERVEIDLPPVDIPLADQERIVFIVQRFLAGLTRLPQYWHGKQKPWQYQ